MVIGSKEFKKLLAIKESAKSTKVIYCRLSNSYYFIHKKSKKFFTHRGRFSEISICNTTPAEGALARVLTVNHSLCGNFLFGERYLQSIAGFTCLTKSYLLLFDSACRFGFGCSISLLNFCTWILISRWPPPCYSIAYRVKNRI